MSDKPKERFLVVDDSSHFSFFIKRTLEERFSAQVKVAWDCASARDIFAREKFDVITLDYVLPDGDGLELLQEFASDEFCPPIIMITGEGDENVAARCLHLGASGYVAKSRDFYARLSEVVDKVRIEVARRRVHDKIKKTSVVLHAIENIEQLVASEADRENFLKGICSNLLEGRDYDNSWIAIVDDSGNVIKGVGASKGGKYIPILDLLIDGILPPCCRRAMGQPGVLVVPASTDECGQCPLAAVSQDVGVMIARLKHAENVYGVLGVYGPIEVVEDKEEIDVLAQVAEDSAYALGVIEIAVERKRAEDAFRERDRRFRAIADTVREAIMILNERNEIDYWNPGAERMYGYASSEVVGKEASDILFDGKDRKGSCDKFKILLKETINGVADGIGEFEISTKDGKKLQVGLSVTNFKIDDTSQVVIVGRNISDLKRDLEVLRISEERYRRLYESFQEGIAAFTGEGMVLECNNTFAAMLGYSPGELLEMPVNDLVAEKSRVLNDGMVDSLAECEFTDEYELEMIKKDGSLLPVSVRAFKAEDGENVAHGWIVIKGIIGSAAPRRNASVTPDKS